MPAALPEAEEVLDNRFARGTVTPRDVLQALTRGKKFADLMEAAPGHWTTDNGGTGREGFGRRADAIAAHPTARGSRLAEVDRRRLAAATSPLGKTQQRLEPPVP